MKGEKIIIYNILRTIVLALCLLLLATCEVGLGPTVDTTAPELSISNPTASAILKGTISLDGSVSDDTSITSVKVKFKGISSSNTNEYEYDATVDSANKKWSLSINTLSGEGVKDGNYELNVTATDNSGKEAVRTTSFYVDNTAPVIMVDTPDVKSTSMNYDVQIEGKLYDQSEVKKLSVVICDDSGREVIRKDANVTNNSTWKATFDGDAELGIKTNSPVLANNSSYYYYVVATDAIDNTSEYFFHKPDVYTQFTGRKLDISEWASFDKGDMDTVSGQRLDRAWFDSIKIRVSNISSPSSISIVPNFSYSSTDFASIEWGNIADGSSLAKDASIVGTITPPANVDSPFKNETFKCYIFPALNNGRNPFAINLETGITMITKLDGSQETPSANNIWPAANIRVTNTGSARNFNISTELPNTHPLYLEGERFYIYIEIENASGTKFFASTDFDINPGTPTLTITTAELSNSLQMTTNGTGDFNITGTAFTSSGYGCDVTYVVKKNGEIEAEGEPEIGADYDETGEWTLPLGPLNLTDGTYSFTFTAEVSGLRAIETRTVTIDRTAPDLSIVAISQDTNGNKVTVSGNANDANGLSSLKYRLTPLQDWQIVAVKYNWVYEIDTTDADEEEKTFEIEVVDAAGNSASASDTIVIDHNPPELTVDNGGWSSKDVQAMTGTASDTHFSSLSVTYRNSSVSSSTAVTETVTVNPTTHAWSWTPDSSAIADGIYDVTFEARDTANKTQTYTTSFTRDQNGPVIEEVSLANNDVTEKGETNSSPLDITVRASDTPAGLKSIEYKVNGGTYTAIPNVSTRSTINLSGLPEGENTIEIKAIDNSDNETIYTYTPEGGTPQSVIHFITDYHEPEVWFGDTVAVTTDLTVNDDVWIKGKLTDGVNTSKMKDAKLSYTKNGITTTIWSLEDGSTSNGFTWNSDSDYKWQWKLEKGSDGANDGRYTFKFNYKDIADNSNTIERTVIMDTTGPTINTVLSNGQTFNQLENAISVSSFDTLSGVEKTMWKLGGDSDDDDDFTEFTGNSITVNFGSEGDDKSLTIVAYDNSGNRAVQTYTGLKVDTSNPTVTIDEIDDSDNDNCKISDTNGTVYINAPLTLTGTVTDSNPRSVGETGLMTLVAYVDGTAVTGTGAINYNKAAGTWEFSVPATSDGPKTVKILATDAVGKTHEVTQAVTVDKTAPTVTIANPGAVSADFTLSATVSDTWIGVSEVKYSLVDSDDDSDWTVMTETGSSYSASITTDSLGGEGTKTIFVKASDGLNWSATPTSTTFFVDTQDPVLTVEASTDKNYTNSNYTLTVSATDANLKNVKITAKKGDTVLIGDGEETGIWKSFNATDGAVTDQTATITAADDHSADGRYTFTITATDNAGKTAFESKSVTIDTTAPTINDEESGEGKIKLPSTTDTEKTSFTFSGTATDGSGSGISTVEISFTKDGADDDTIDDNKTDALGQETWSYPLDFTGTLFATEGTKEVHIRATDTAGNVGEWVTKDFVYDKSKPTITETTLGSVAELWRNATFSVGGTVTDTYGLKAANNDEAFTLTVTKNVTEDNNSTTSSVTVTPALTPVAGTDDAENCTSYTWSADIPVEEGESAEYTIKAKAKDLSGKSSSEVERVVSIDKVAPTLTFTSLSETERKNIDGNTYTVTGTITDDYSGIQSVLYKLNNGSDFTNQDITLSGSSWRLPLQLGDDGLAEGEYTITVKASDKAGNWTAEKTASFMVDLEDPTVEFDDATSIPEYINEDHTLTGTVDDSNPLSVGATGAMTLTAYINGTEATDDDAISYDRTAGTWSFVLPVTETTTNGAKTVKIKAVDAAGKTKEVTHVVTVDKTPPVVTVVNPGSKDAGFTLTANVYDTDKGMTDGSVSWSFNENATEAPEDATDEEKEDASQYWQAMTFGTGSTYTAEITDDDLGTTEGEKHIYVKATDGLNESAPVDTSFYLDKADPVLSVTTSTESSYTNSNYTLTVNATDANLKDVVITAKKDDTVLTGDGEKNGIWKSITATAGAVTNQTATLTVPSDPEDHSADGTYTFNITATDNAGKTAFASKTVTVDTTVPTVADTFAVPDTAATEGSSYRFSGTASDGNGIDKVEISFTADDADESTILANKTDAAGQTGWSYTLVFADNTTVFNTVFNTEGDKEVHVRATDVAGNVSPWVTKDFVYDKNAPTSTISQYKNNGGSDTDITANSFETGKVFELKGSASDTYGIANVKIYQQIGDEAAVLIDTLSTASWTLQNLPRKISAEGVATTDTLTEDGKPISGTYKYYAKAEDSSGKMTDSATITVKIDTTAPTVSITAPDSSVSPTNDKTGENSLSDDSYTFRGTASDSHVGAIGVAKLMYAFVKADDAFNATEPTVTDWAEQAATDGNWSVSRTLSSGTGTPARGELNEAHWYFFAKSVDAAGNESDVSKIHFHVDKSSPTLAMTTNNVKDKENATYYFKTDASFNATDGTITLAGTTSDTYGIKSVSITTKAGDSDAVTTALATSGSWTHSFAVPADTTVSVTITATDNSDKTLTKKYTLYRDTEAPTLEIISPASEESFFDNMINLLKGTVSDEGSGVKTSINYSITKEGDAAATKEGTITRNGESWTLNSVDFRLEDDETGEFITQEGTFSLTITAEDTLGNSEEQTVVFYVDKADPTLSETGVGTGGKTTNETFTLSGWVHETNGLNSDAAVTISADKEGFTNIVLAANNLIKVADGTSTTELAADATFEGWYYWTKTFYVNGAVAGQNGVPDGATILANGTYVFTITAKDVAGKTAAIQRTVKVDTTAPVFSPKTENGSDFIYYTATDTVSGEPWMDRAVVDISVKVDDEANGSGINTVEYETAAGSTGVLRKSGTDWIASVPLSDGENNIRIKATDVAGNVSYKPEPNGNTANYETIRVDTTAPEVSVDSSTQDIITNVRASSFYLNIAESGSGINTITATLGSGNNARTVTKTNSDYGVIEDAEATITVNGNSMAATHKITLNAAALTGLSGSVKLTVKAADNVGNESTSVNVANITIDTEDPTIENMDFNVASGNQSYVYATTDDSADYAYFVKGGTFRITGRTRDNIGIENTKVQVGSGEAQDVAPDGNGWHIDVTPTDSGSHTTTVTVTATDKAGNTAEQTIKLIFDTTAPVPEHIIDSKRKDLVFRVGNYNNDSRGENPALAWNPDLDEDVGGKYSQGTYGNTRTITLRGHYIDEGSGLRRIYYKFYDTEYINLNESQILDLIDDVVGSNQYIVPLANPTTKRVFYKGTTTPSITGTEFKAAANGNPAEYYTEITTNFVIEALGPLPNNENYFVLVAEDNVGNKVVDYAEVPNENGVGTTKYYNYVLNVDTIAPSIPTVQSITYKGATITLNDGENLMVNQSLMGTNDTINITLTAEDTGGSGVKSVELTRLGTNVLDNEDRIDSTDGDNSYTVKIPKAKVMSGAVSVRITDNAGNAADFGLFSITNDSTAPTVTLSSHNSDTTVNKTITLKGTAEDTNGVDSVVGVYYTRNEDCGTATLEGNTTLPGSVSNNLNADSEWVPYTSSNKSGTNSWSIEVDTEATGFTNGVDHYFTVAVKDKAGNIGYSTPVKLKIDQSTDCPVISLRNLSTDGTGKLKNTKEIYGAVSDDDGNISTIYVSQNSGASWNSVNVQNGSWTYNVTGDDGAKELYFKVTDPEGAVFATNRVGNSESTPVGDVYLTDQTNTITGPLTFSIDRNPPEINAVEIYIKGNGENSEKQFQNNQLMGGKNTSFELKVPVYDANGIDSVYITIGDNDHKFDGEILTPTPDEPDGCGIWKISGIDISGNDYTDGYQTAVITVEDKSSVTSSITRQVLIDKTAPSVTIESHSAGEIVTGLITLKGLSDDGIDASGIDNIKWMIPEANSASTINKDSTGWNDVTSGSIQWSIAFTTEASELKNYANTTYGTEIMEGGVGTNVWEVPVFLRIEDKAGNADVYKEFYFRVDPDGDKPKVAVTYPTVGSDGSAPILGGSIRIFGTADDNVSVKAVYMQVDVNNDGSFDNADKTNADLGSGENGGHYTIYEEEANAKKNNNQAWWGIKVTGTNSWNMTINSYGEFNPSSGNQRTIKIRFRAVDNNDLCSGWSAPLSIVIDKTAPRIGSSEPLKLVQYSDNTAGTGNPVAVLDYQSDMWIKGKWWLTGSVEDESGIASITLENVNEYDVTIATSAVQTGSVQTWGANEGYSFKIPINTTSFAATNTTVSFKIVAKDNIAEGSSQQTATQTISLKYDNTPPEIGTLKHVSTEIGSGETDETTVIEQSNQAFSIEGTVTDGGSGFYRMAVYFKRIDSDGSNPRIHNPYDKDPADTEDLSERLNKNTTRTDISATQSSGSVSMDEDDGLPMLYFESVTRNDEETLVVNSVDKNIQKGGLVKIGGVYRLIKGVTRTASQTTVTFTPSVDVSYTKAWFVCALIIDNFKVETPLYGNSSSNAPTTISNHDDDWIVESIEKIGGLYNWSVAIDSKMIPDGPIDICCVAFDQAGNVKIGSPVSTSVQNNRPAIAKIWLGTDYNGNGEIYYNNTNANDPKNEKIVIFTADQSETNWQKKQENTQVVVDVTDTDKHFNFKAVGKTVIEPEIVGGNGALYYYTAKDSATTYTGRTLLRATETSDITPIVLNVTDPLSANAKLADLGNGDHTFKFKIWDSTENLSGNSDTEALNNSQWASINVKFNVNVVDIVDPAALIKPFFWKGNGTGNNSVYGTNSAAYKKDNSSYGHIELENDLPSDFNGSSGLMDRDPKVSGIIRIQGMAYDDTRLKEIAVSVDGFSLAGGATGSSVKLAKLDGGWKYYNGSTWVNSPVDNLTDAGWTFSVTKDKGITSDGHEVEWELILDTSFYAKDATHKVTGTDVGINVAVYDGFGRASKSGVTQITSFSGDPVVNASTDTTSSETVEWDNTTGCSTITAVTYEDGYKTTVTTAATPYYKMDIVPYIQEVTTSLSKLRQSNPSVYARTALGHYAVSSAEKLIIQGFNISGGVLNFTKTETTTVTSSYDESDGKYAIPTTAVSGKVSIKVNGVESLNNINNNGAYGTAYQSAPVVDAVGSVYKDMLFYNRQPNGENNNLLSDDVILDIWQINSEAGKPKSGPLSQPVMAINPKNKQVGFAFANGPLNFSMGSLEKSYMNWEGGVDFWTSIGFAYDANGNSFGTAAGGDINDQPSADSFAIFTSRWGERADTDKYGHNRGQGQLRIELIGQAYSTNGSGWDGNNIHKQRIQSSSIATTVANATATSTNVYLAYYDAINDEIRFKWGIFSDSDNLVRSNDANDLFVDYYGKPDAEGGNDNTKGTVSLTKSKKVAELPYTLEYVSLIAGQTKDKWTFVPGSGTGTKYKATTAVMTRDNKPVHAGQYVSIAAKYQGGDTYPIVTNNPVLDEETGEPVIDEETGEIVYQTESFTDDLVVAVWYDATNNQMLYSYNTKPKKIKAPTYGGNDRYIQNADGTSSGIDSFSQNATGWSTPVAVFGEGNGIGEYCKVVLDANGKVHIACYDNANADVWYAYLEDFDDPENAKTCIVDSYGIVGTELSIDVALKGGNPVPYISYYGNSCARPKVAYWASGTSIASATDLNGAEDEAATSNWEVCVIPSTSKISMDHINVGVWKDSSGNLTNSKKPNGTIGSTTSGTDNGTIYGNGTSNPILGYAITKGAGGYIETAQMK